MGKVPNFLQIRYTLPGIRITLILYHRLILGILPMTKTAIHHEKRIKFHPFLIKRPAARLAGRSGNSLGSAGYEE